MRRKNIFLAVLLSAAMASSSVTPAFAESLTDGETAVMETAEETKTEPMEEIQEENTEAEQMPVLTESPDELLMEETDELPQEETNELENAADERLEAPEMIEEHLETEEYTKELIAQTSGPLVDTGNCAMGSRTYGIKTPDTIYYNAFKLYDEDKRFVGIQVDQYTDESGTSESHWLSIYMVLRVQKNGKHICILGRRWWSDSSQQFYQEKIWLIMYGLICFGLFRGMENQRSCNYRI